MVAAARSAAVLVALLLTAVLLFGDLLGLRINLSRSIPIGLYRRVREPILRGALVEGRSSGLDGGTHERRTGSIWITSLSDPVR